MPLPETLDVQAALIYFHAYMHGPYKGRVRLFRQRGLAPRMVMSEDWEVFASILLKTTGAASRSGPDLGDYEVKSAVDGGSFEYQYHRNSWKEKLAADRHAGHVFIWHWDELSHIEVWFCEGPGLDAQAHGRRRTLIRRAGNSAFGRPSARDGSGRTPPCCCA